MRILSFLLGSMGKAAGKAGQKLAESKILNRIDRLKYLAVFILILNAALVFRLFTIQVGDGQFYRALAADQHELWAKLFPARGEILDDPRRTDRPVPGPEHGRDVHRVAGVRAAFAWIIRWQYPKVGRAASDVNPNLPVIPQPGPG